MRSKSSSQRPPERRFGKGGSETKRSEVSSGASRTRALRAGIGVASLLNGVLGASSVAVEADTLSVALGVGTSSIAVDVGISAAGAGGGSLAAGGGRVLGGFLATRSIGKLGSRGSAPAPPRPTPTIVFSRLGRARP